MVVEDVKISVCQISDVPYDPLELGMRPCSYYEFPDGYNHPFLSERFRITETLFNTELDVLNTSGDPVTLPELIHKSLMKCDIDIRPLLCNQIILCGGSSLFSGLSERLSSELSRIMPTVSRCKPYATHSSITFGHAHIYIHIFQFDCAIMS